MSTTREFRVSGMTCAHCEGAVREEVTRISGVTTVEVDATSGLMRVTAAETVADDAVVAAVVDAGYTVASP